MSEEKRLIGEGASVTATAPLPTRIPIVITAPQQTSTNTNYINNELTTEEKGSLFVLGFITAMYMVANQWLYFGVLISMYGAYILLLEFYEGRGVTSKLFAWFFVGFATFFATVVPLLRHLFGLP